MVRLVQTDFGGFADFCCLGLFNERFGISGFKAYKVRSQIPGGVRNQGSRLCGALTLKGLSPMALSL